MLPAHIRVRAEKLEETIRNSAPGHVVLCGCGPPLDWPDFPPLVGLTRPVDPNSTCRYHIKGAQGVLDLVVTYDVLGNFSSEAIWKELERRFPLSPTTPPTVRVYQEGYRLVSDPE